jgi:hypothetical protein
LPVGVFMWQSPDRASFRRMGNRPVAGAVTEIPQRKASASAWLHRRFEKMCPTPR